MQPNEKGTRKDLVLYRIETSKSDVKAAEILLAARESGVESMDLRFVTEKVGKLSEFNKLCQCEIPFE